MHHSSIKWYICGQFLFTVHTLCLDVGWSKIIDVACPFLSCLRGT
jgi:hypothetical protein